MKLISALVLFAALSNLMPYTANAQTGLTSFNSITGDIEDWWIKCNGNSIASTCLEERELSRFKTLCMNESNKADCRAVTDYVVAKSRLSEAKRLLRSGQSALRKIFAESRSYPKDPEKIWDQTTVSAARSFAVGILPSCLKKNKKALLFGRNIRPEVDELREQLQNYYEKLAAIPCPGGEPILVVVGLIHDSKMEFDSYTVGSENKFKTISSSLRASPFAPETDEVASILKSK